MIHARSHYIWTKQVLQALITSNCTIIEKKILFIFYSFTHLSTIISQLFGQKYVMKQKNCPTSPSQCLQIALIIQLAHHNPKVATQVC